MARSHNSIPSSCSARRYSASLLPFSGWRVHGHYRSPEPLGPFVEPADLFKGTTLIGLNKRQHTKPFEHIDSAGITPSPQTLSLGHRLRSSTITRAPFNAKAMAVSCPQAHPQPPQLVSVSLGNQSAQLGLQGTQTSNLTHGVVHHAARFLEHKPIPRLWCREFGFKGCGFRTTNLAR